MADYLDRIERLERHVERLEAFIARTANDKRNIVLDYDGGLREFIKDVVGSDFWVQISAQLKKED